MGGSGLWALELVLEVMGLGLFMSAYTSLHGAYVLYSIRWRLELGANNKRFSRLRRRLRLVMFKSHFFFLILLPKISRFFRFFAFVALL